MNYLEKIIYTLENNGCEVKLTRDKKSIYRKTSNTRVLREANIPNGFELYKKIYNVSGTHNSMYIFNKVLEKLMSNCENIFGGNMMDNYYGILKRDEFVFLIDKKTSSIYVYK